MAYAAASITRKGRDYIVTLAGTSIGATTEATLAGLPIKGRILRVRASKSAGDATTLDPVVGLAADPANGTVLFQNGTAAAGISVEPNAGIGARYYAATGTLYYRDVPDSGTNNTTAVELLIREGWAG